MLKSSHQSRIKPAFSHSLLGSNIKIKCLTNVVSVTKYHFVLFQLELHFKFSDHLSQKWSLNISEMLCWIRTTELAHIHDWTWGTPECLYSVLQWLAVLYWDYSALSAWQFRLQCYLKGKCIMLGNRLCSRHSRIWCHSISRCLYKGLYRVRFKQKFYFLLNFFDRD